MYFLVIRSFDFYFFFSIILLFFLFADLFVLKYVTNHELFGSIQYVKGQRGSRKMVCGGFSYICAKIKKGRKYWVCAKQRSRNCKARIITDLHEFEFYTRNLSHNHDADNNVWKNAVDQFDSKIMDFVGLE